MKKEKILGFNVCSIDEKEIINRIFLDYQNNEQVFIVNINPEIAVDNYNNDELKSIFNEQKYQIPDGAGIVWASKRQNGNIKERITGIDLMNAICKNLCEFDAKIFLYGSKEGISEKAKIELEKLYPKINIVGTCSGYEYENIAIEKINKSNANILFVGLGSPKQEQFIIKNMDKLKDIKIFMPVGGSFDVISKTKKRAPNWVIKCNLEWLYRLFQEPKRIFRQFKLIKFMYLVRRETHEKN